MCGQPRCADATTAARHACINHSDRSISSEQHQQRVYSAADAAVAALSSQLRLRIDATLLKLVSNTVSRWTEQVYKSGCRSTCMRRKDAAKVHERR